MSVNIFECIIADEIYKEIHNGKNANHIRHIVICKETECQGGYIQFTASFVYDSFNAQNNERKKIHSINPHYIPIICDKEAAESIHQTEC